MVDKEKLPVSFPTHKHMPEFWEALGRTVATFGFLEEALGKAIFSFTATCYVPAEKLQTEFEKWLPTLERALTDPLSGLIKSYDKAVRSNTKATIANLDNLITDLRKASVIRNVLCHGSWREPDKAGRSLPLFVGRAEGIFQTPIDTAYLKQVQAHALELACAVMNSVAHMGYQFPGSNGPGLPILPDQRADPEARKVSTNRP